MLPGQNRYYMKNETASAQADVQPPDGTGFTAETPVLFAVPISQADPKADFCRVPQSESSRVNKVLDAGKSELLQDPGAASVFCLKKQFHKPQPKGKSIRIRR